MTRISIDPITRLEGHGRIDLFLDEAGELADALLVIPELRGFEKFVEGRPIEEMPLITPRICGVCPEAHHAAAAKAADAVYSVTIPPAAEVIRRLQYNAFTAGDHATHFYALGGPDLIVGAGAPPAERNLVGVIRKVGPELSSALIRMRREAHEIAEMLGGRRVSPVGMVPGGQARPVTEEMRAQLREIGAYMVEFARHTQQVFADVVLADPALVDLVLSETYTNRTCYAALVDENGRCDSYDGAVRVVDADGAEIERFASSEYAEHIAEHVEPWSYLKFPYLRSLGWKGIADDAGLLRVAPLGMLNAADGMKTPLAQQEYERMYATLGGKPVHNSLAYHWARIIEMLQCAELVAILAEDERLTDPDVRRVPDGVPTEGVGIVEAPRGLLLHHYVTDADGIVRKANLIVGTTFNHGAIQLSVKKAASELVRAGAEITEEVFNRIEMAFRAYDPCFGCATHAAGPGSGLVVTVRDAHGVPLHTAVRAEDGSIRQATPESAQQGGGTGGR